MAVINKDKPDMKSKGYLLENKWFMILLIALASIIVYYNSLRTPFVFDDITYLVNNLNIRQLSNIGTKLIIHSRFLTFITFALNYHFSELDTFGYHLFNIVIHISTAVLMFFFVRKIIHYTFSKDSILFPAFVSLLFAVHPINTDAVTYIYNRSASLAAFFYFLSILFFIKTIKNNRYFILISLVSFIFSFFSKETAITLPVILFIFDYIFLSDFSMKRVLERKYIHLCFWIMMIFLVLVEFLHFSKFEYIRKSTIGLFFPYLLTQPWLITKYMKLLIFPSGLCIDHKIVAFSTVFDSKVFIPLSIIAVIFVLAWILHKKKTDVSKIILFGILWFFITLLPTIIINVHPGERHIYLSGLGFYLILAGIYFLIFKKKFYVNRSWFLLVILIIYTSVYGFLTVNRNKLYKDPILLWSDAISKYPKNKGAYNSIGEIYEDRGYFDKAMVYYSVAVGIDPGYAPGFNNRGNIYYKQKEYDKAMLDYNQAIRINPDYADAYYNRANVYVEEGKYDKAISDYTEAIRIKPNFLKSYNNRGNAYIKEKEYEKALNDYNRAIEINPGYGDAYYNLAIFYFNRKKYDRTWEYVRKLQSLKYNIDPEFIEELKKASSTY